ncbi:MAG: hypothetical protein ACM3P1_13310 [Candidatus Saccharibacteria bacterium]
MRTIALAALLAFCIGCRKEAENKSTIDSLVSNNKVWYVSEYPDPCPGCVWPHKIQLGKDTVIDNKTYQPIHDYTGDAIESHNVTPRVLGYLRETADGKVYWLQGSNNLNADEILLYDFKARVNDTIENLVVTKTDTVNILNVKRKRILLRDCTTTYEWIEGIGNMADILSYANRPVCDYKTGIVCEMVGGSGFKQTCVRQGNNFIYKDSTSNDCWHYAGLNE